MNEEMNEAVEAEVSEEVVEEVEATTEPVDEESSEQVEEVQEHTEPTEKTFTQSELDDIINKRLSRERSKFEKEQTTLKQQAKDEYIASQGYEWNGKKITTEAEYSQAMKEQEIYNNLVNNKGFTEEQAKELANERMERESIKKELEALKAKEQETNAIVDVMNWHEEMRKKGVLTNEFDYSKIPDEVINSGASLKESYMSYILENMKLETQQSTLKNIDAKKELSAGSTQDKLPAEEGTFSLEYINKMASGAGGTKWIKANYDKIEKAGYFN